VLRELHDVLSAVSARQSPVSATVADVYILRGLPNVASDVDFAVGMVTTS